MGGGQSGHEGAHVQIRGSAREHGIADDDIQHAFENAITFVQGDFRGDQQLLIIGPARDGTLLELVAYPAEDPNRIVHADRLRSKYYQHLGRGE